MWDCSKLVQQQRFAGVYVTIAQQLVWDGIIFVRQGTFYREEKGKKRKCQFSRTLLGNKSYVDSPVQPSILLTSWPTFHARHCYTNPCLFFASFTVCCAVCCKRGLSRRNIPVQNTHSWRPSVQSSTNSLFRFRSLPSPDRCANWRSKYKEIFPNLVPWQKQALVRNKHASNWLSREWACVMHSY